MSIIRFFLDIISRNSGIDVKYTPIILSASHLLTLEALPRQWVALDWYIMQCTFNVNQVAYCFISEKKQECTVNIPAH